MPLRRKYAAKMCICAPISRLRPAPEHRPKPMGMLVLWVPRSCLEGAKALCSNAAQEFSKLQLDCVTCRKLTVCATSTELTFISN